MNDLSRTEIPATPANHKGRLFVLIALTAVVLGVLLLLPHYVSEPWLAATTETPDSQSDTGVLTPSQAIQNKQFRSDAQSVLADIITLRTDLQERGAADWGRFEFNKAIDSIERGDNRYLDAHYAQAISDYNQALESLIKIEATAVTALAQALKVGFQSLENGAIDAAATAVTTALAIAPYNPKVLELASRAERLPRLMAQVQQAQQLLNAGQFDEAREAFLRALMIDKAHGPTQTAVGDLTRQLRDRDFKDAMSRGWGHLNERRFSEAEQAFNRAGKTYPDQKAVSQALEQLKIRRIQDQTREQIKRALIYEKEEKWQQALTIYKALLAADNTLTEPRVRQVNASIRADLERQVTALLAQPLILSDERQFARAEKLLTDLQGLLTDGRKAPRLVSQINALDSALKGAKIPVEIVFQSDGITDITLYPVQKLGRFIDKQLRLKPGYYRIAGAREGYRDVWVEFTVKGNSNTMPIDIRCRDVI